MATTTIQTPTSVANDYLTKLAALKPDVNISQTDSDWWVRSRVTGGVIAGVYADQRLIANDAFPQRAREDAVLRFLDLYFNSGLNPATQANGNVVVSGNPGTTITQGLQMAYTSNGNTYQATETVVLSTAATGTVTGSVPVQSVNSGQSQNLLPGAVLAISSPPAGLMPTATVDANGLADATDQESLTEARARIVTRIQESLSVGRVTDYEQYAEAADPSVTSASVLRYPFGLGTVGVYITSGTTDIDAAIDNGDPISVIPSDELVAKVQAYLDINSPVTDCVTVFKPTTVTVDVTVQVDYASGDGSTILTGQTLTQDQLVEREVMRAIYKTPVGGRQITTSLGTSGYVLASDIEQGIDSYLSNQTTLQGSNVDILNDRQVLPLSATGYNFPLLPDQVAIPGVITVVSE